jgi:hypothetical protein
MREASCLGYGACEHHERSKTPAPAATMKETDCRVRNYQARRTARGTVQRRVDQAFRGPKSGQQHES